MEEISEPDSGRSRNNFIPSLATCSLKCFSPGPRRTQTGVLEAAPKSARRSAEMDVQDGSTTRRSGLNPFLRRTSACSQPQAFTSLCPAASITSLSGARDSADRRTQRTSRVDLTRHPGNKIPAKQIERCAKCLRLKRLMTHTWFCRSSARNLKSIQVSKNLRKPNRKEGAAAPRNLKESQCPSVETDVPSTNHDQRGF